MTTTLRCCVGGCGRENRTLNFSNRMGLHGRRFH